MFLYLIGYKFTGLSHYTSKAELLGVYRNKLSFLKIFEEKGDMI